MNSEFVCICNTHKTHSQVNPTPDKHGHRILLIIYVINISVACLFDGCQTQHKQQNDAECNVHSGGKVVMNEY